MVTNIGRRSCGIDGSVSTVARAWVAHTAATMDSGFEKNSDGEAEEGGYHEEAVMVASLDAGDVTDQQRWEVGKVPIVRRQ